MLYVCYIFGSIFTALPLILGVLLMFFPPKEISMTFGVRTKAIAQDNESWAFGNKLAARWMTICSGIGAILFVVPLVIFSGFFGRYFFIVLLMGVTIIVASVLIAIGVADSKTRKFNYARYKAKKAKAPQASGVTEK